ncbi:MAG TPA: hypothetical protein QF753_09375 [Victivallales bacterium]|nr:hypothetical protein [Victivallales bacterium]
MNKKNNKLYKNEYFFVDSIFDCRKKTVFFNFLLLFIVCIFFVGCGESKPTKKHWTKFERIDAPNQNSYSYEGKQSTKVRKVLHAVLQYSPSSHDGWTGIKEKNGNIYIQAEPFVSWRKNTQDFQHLVNNYLVGYTFLVFANTDINKVSITVLPIKQFTKPQEDKVFGYKYDRTIQVTREKALKVAQKYFGVLKLNQLIVDNGGKDKYHGTLGKKYYSALKNNKNQKFSEIANALAK